MKINLLDVQLESASAAYFSGQAVAGCLLVNCADACQVDRIAVRLAGETHTAWVNKVSDVVYDTTEPHIDQTLDLTQYAGADDTGQGGMLSAGLHQIKFSFQLPATLPSSLFNEQFGYTRYLLVGTVNTSKTGCYGPTSLGLATGGGDALRCEKALRVYSVISVAMPELMQPNMIQDAVEMSGCCGSAGTLHATLQLPHSGYLLGETLTAQVTIMNDSTKRISGGRATLALCQKLTFMSQNIYELLLWDKKEVISVVDNVQMEHAPARDQVTHVVSVPIPLTIPPTSAAVPNKLNVPVTITYFLRLEVGPYDLFLPVVIGTSR